MTVYKRNPLLMTVMGANPGRRRQNPIGEALLAGATSAVVSHALQSNPSPTFIVIDSITGRVMYTKQASGVGSEAIRRCVTKAHEFARRNRRSYIVFLNMSWAKVGHQISVAWARAMGITEEVHPDGSVTRGNPQSNPHLEGGPCSACSGSLSYQGTLGNREHYRCRNCGLDFSTQVGPSRRRRHYKKLCGHGYVTALCRICRGRRMDPRIKPCSHGVSGGGTRCVACQRMHRLGGPVQNNPAISRSWDGLKTRPRLAILEFAGIPYDQARRLAARPWETLPPSVREDVSKGWQENPRPLFDYYPGKRPAGVPYCGLCGNWSKAYRPLRLIKTGEYAGKKFCKPCYQGAKESGEFWAKNPQPNPGSKRRLTMTIEKFAQWVKSKRDPVMWKAFLAKFRGYEKWTHGAKAQKVTLEWVDTPGVNGLWITYDGGKQPESTYIMPKGVPRKGAWKHPWDTMPDIKHDPEAKIVITKLRGSSKITDFYHK